MFANCALGERCGVLGYGGTMPTLLRAAGVLVLALLIVGCSGSRVDEPEVTPTGALEQVGAVSTIEELVNAYVAAGGDCEWERTDEVTPADASGTCRALDAQSCEEATDWARLSFFSSTSARDEAAGEIRSGECELSLLVGENWIVDASDAVDVAVEMGGRLYR